MTMRDVTRILLAKLETEYGGDPTPTPAANALLAENVEYDAQLEIRERNPVRSTLSKIASVIGKKVAELKFSVELKGSGSAGTAARIGALLQACGFAETIDAGSSVVYSPTSIPVSTKSITLYYYELADTSAILYKITGARGNFDLNIVAGDIAKLNFTFRGLYNDPADVAKPSNPTHESTLPPITENASMVVGGTSDLVVKDMNIGMNNSLADRIDVNTAGGVARIEIADRSPGGKFSPELALLATKDYFSLLEDGTESNIHLTIGSAVGNKVIVDIPKAQVDKVSPASESGLSYKDINFKCNKNSSGDDELSFQFL